MGFIKTQVDGAPDPEEPTVHAESEVDLRIATAEFKYASTGRGMVAIMAIIEAEDGNEYQPIFHNLLLPLSEEVDAYVVKKGGGSLDDAGEKLAANYSRFRLDEKRFLACFGVESGEEGWEVEDLHGAEGRCKLKMDEYEGNLKNVLVLPRLK